MGRRWAAVVLIVIGVVLLAVAVARWQDKGDVPEHRRESRGGEVLQGMVGVVLAGAGVFVFATAADDDES